MKSKQQDKQQGKLNAVPATKAGGRRWVIGIGVLLVLAAAFLMFWPEQRPTPTEKASPSAPSAPSQTEDNARPGRLVGRWLRSDGVYFIDIRGLTIDGRLDAGYYNPNPIHVGRAEWKKQNGKLQILVELRDENYPGSIYTLELQEAGDRMVGTYYQAVEKVSYDVEFVRER